MEKLLPLLKVFRSNPAEFYDRVGAILQVNMDRYLRRRPQSIPEQWDLAVGKFSEAIGQDLSSYLAESHLQEIEETVSRRIAELPAGAPFITGHNGDVLLARLSYAFCRILRPQTVLEVGTCYGVTSAFMLKALQVNAAGSLHSIDLPPLGESADSFVGFCIPEELKNRWTLYRGASHRILPGLLGSLRSVDIFLHDSLHTYGNILRECRSVQPHLSCPSVVLVDDVDENAAFLDWTSEADPSSWAVVSRMQESEHFGVRIFNSKPCQPESKRS